MLASLKSCAVLAVVTSATISSAATVEKRQIFTCATGKATCCKQAIDASTPNLSSVISELPIVDAVLGPDVTTFFSGIGSLTGKVGVLCGPDSGTGCDGETPLCCAGTSLTLPLVGTVIATGCTATLTR